MANLTQVKKNTYGTSCEQFSESYDHYFSRLKQQHQWHSRGDFNIVQIHTRVELEQLITLFIGRCFRIGRLRILNIRSLYDNFKTTSSASLDLRLSNCAKKVSTVSDIKKAPWRNNCPVFQRFLVVVYSVAFLCLSCWITFTKELSN